MLVNRFALNVEDPALDALGPLAVEFREVYRILESFAEGQTTQRGSTRDRLIEAAVLHFRQGGFTGTSMRQLAKAIGVTPAALYSHFESKHELIGAAFAFAYMNALAFTISRAAHAPLAERLSTLVRLQIDYEVNEIGQSSWFDLVIDNGMLEEVVPPEVVPTVRRTRRLITSVFSYLLDPNGHRRLEAEMIMRLCLAAPGTLRALEKMDAAGIEEYTQLVLRIADAE